MTTTAARRPRVRPRRLAMLALAVTTGLATGLGGAVVAQTSASADTTSQYGTLSAPSGQLPAANQCGTYSYRYDLTPPPGDWALETFVVDPRGNTVSSYALIGGYAGGTNGSTSYTLCTNNTQAGVFTITGKMSTQTRDSRGRIVTSNYEMTPSTFTLTDAPVATTTQPAAKNKKASKKAKKKAERKKQKNRKKKNKNRR